MFRYVPVQTDDFEEFYQAAIRLTVDAARRARRARMMSTLLAVGQRGGTAGRYDRHDPLEATALSIALMRLPLPQRQVLVLHYLADLPVDDIARDCGVAAAGDDRTFVIQAAVGGTQQEVNGRKIGPQMNPTGVSPYSLSWAGDQHLAFEWSAGNNLHPPGLGMRVLDVTAPGNLLKASRLVVAYTRYCAALGACQDFQLLTADGSKLLLTSVAGPSGNYTDSVLEYSVRTGQRLAQVIPTVHTPYAGPPCQALWSDPSGEQVISFCGEHGELYDHGHLGRITLHPPMYGLNFAAQFAW